MAAKAETLLQQSERRPPPPQDSEPLALDFEIERQQSVFDDALENYQKLLIPDDLSQQVRMQMDLFKENIYPDPIERPTVFLALATAVEVIRNPHHSPSWQQAEAALHMIFPYDVRAIQLIQMATGEGKTFTIALASLWAAVQGKSVTVHTDKKANVEQSHTKMAGLFDMFHVTHDTVRDAQELGENYYNYLNGLEQDDELPMIRYGTWAQCMHEYLARQQVIFQCEAYLRGDMEVQRKGNTLAADGREVLEKTVAYQKKHLIPDVIPVDEGDVSVHMEASPVIISSLEAELTPREKADLTLAWKMFQEQQPNRGPQLGTIDRIAQALDFDADEMRRRFEVIPQITVEGLKQDDLRSAVTTVGVNISIDTFYEAKLLEATVTPSLLSQMMDLMKLQYQDGDLPQLPLLLTTIERIQNLAAATSISGEDKICWDDIEEALPKLTRHDLNEYFGQENKFFNYQELLRKDSRLQAILSHPNDSLLPAELETLKEVFGDSYEQLMQRITIIRLANVVAMVWEPMMTRFNHDLCNVKYLMKEGNDYQIDGEEVTLLGPDRQPQPGKQFQGNIQSFIHLKHGLELPQPDVTIAQIMPSTWYEMSARRGAKVTSLSGTQDEPDFEVRSTGTGRVEVLPSRLFANQEQKLRGIVHYIKACAKLPILLCAQNHEEVVQLEEMLKRLSGRELKVLDAKHADEAAILVPWLGDERILLLQITARGLDFGHLLDDGQGHSLQNVHIIIVGMLPDPHQQRQTEQRAGGKRPSGSVTSFVAFDDKLAQEYYSLSPETAQNRHERIVALERRYVQLSLKSSIDHWPASLGEALSSMSAWEESYPESDTRMPAWMWFANENKDFKKLRYQFSRITQRHLRDLNKQQNNNLRQLYENRRQHMVVDVVIQNLWLEIMDPTENTSLGKVLLPLSYEQRQGIIERVFEEANYLYMLSAAKVKDDPLAPNEVIESLKMAQFMTDMVDRITMWVDLENLERRYLELKAAGLELTNKSIIPEQMIDLAHWLREHEVSIPKVSLIRKSIAAVTERIFLGLRTSAEPVDQDRAFFNSLRGVAQKETQIRRKFQTEK